VSKKPFRTVPRPSYPALKLACQNCLMKTNHKVLRETTVEDFVPEYDMSGWDQYQIVRCNGCKQISFCHVRWADWDLNPETEEPIASTTVYPYRLSGRKMIGGLAHIPGGVRRVYEETHSTLAADNPILGTVGIRAVVEAVCNNKNAKGRSLVEKIDDLVKQGWLSQKEAEFLHKSRVLGNVAAHELKPPDSTMLQTALDIIETLLKTVYVLPGTLKPDTVSGRS